MVKVALGIVAATLVLQTPVAETQLSCPIQLFCSVTEGFEG